MKGDGWAVKRYVCPCCKRKGLYYDQNDYGGIPWTCMYKNCESKNDSNLINRINVIEYNPILNTEKPQWKP